MTPDRYHQLREHFIAVSERQPSERDQYLREECADDPELRAELEALLEADCDSPDIEGASKALWLLWLRSGGAD